MKVLPFPLTSKEAGVIIGRQVENNKRIYILLMAIISIFELVLLIRGFIVFSFTTYRSYLYTFSYAFLLISSIGVGIFIATSLKKKYSYKSYNIVLHLYILAIITWSIIISFLDIGYQSAPIVYFTVIVTIAGIIIIEPFFYIAILLISSCILILLDSFNGFNYLKSTGEFINFFVFVSMAILINLRHFIVSVKEFHATSTLEESVLEERNRVSTISLQTIKSISNAVDAKDKYTQEHSQRVAEYSSIIAKNLNWSPEKIKEIHEIALLHDIGKIGVPDAILNCTTRLTKEEFELMKQHTVIGGEILKDLTILKNVDLGAKYHHERYDGTGYPSGLKGKDIPLEARIIAVADAFDAMNSNRIYRSRLTKEKILSELVEGKGKQFDPEIIDVFLPYAQELLK